MAKAIPAKASAPIALGSGGARNNSTPNNRINKTTNVQPRVNRSAGNQIGAQPTQPAAAPSVLPPPTPPKIVLVRNPTETTTQKIQVTPAPPPS